VGSLVLDVALVADLGRQRAHPVAGFLDLAREWHDREELGLRLRELLASPDRGEVEALDVGVDGVGRAPAFGHGLNDGRGTDPDVARGEDPGPAGLEQARA